MSALLIERCAALTLTLVYYLASAAPVNAETYHWQPEAGGLYKEAANWLPLAPAGPPADGDDAVFNLNSATGYTVTLSPGQVSDRLIVRSDRVTFDATQPNVEFPLGNQLAGVIVGQLAGDVGRLALTRGTMLFNSGVLGLSLSSSGSANLSGNETSWEFINSLQIGTVGSGTLNIADEAELRTNTGVVNIGAQGTLDLTGGIFNTHGQVNLYGGRLTRDASGQFNLGNGGILLGLSASQIQLAGATTVATGTTYDLREGSTLRTDGALTVNGLLTLNNAITNANGTNGRNAGSNGPIPISALPGSAGHDVTIAAGSALLLDDGASLEARGGSGGKGTLLSAAREGAAAGDIEINGGTVLLSGMSTFDLRGGAGGAGGGLSGANGGNGGTLRLNGGELALMNGRVLLDGGNGGSKGIIGDDGIDGAAGQVVVDAGEFNWHAGSITTDSAASVATPIGLIGASLTVNGGALHLLDNSTLDGGVLTRGAAAALTLAHGKTLTATNGARVDLSGPSAFAEETSWNFFQGSQLSLKGALNIIGTANFDDATVDANGAEGQLGTLTSAGVPGGAGQLTTVSGQLAIATGTTFNARGGNGAIAFGFPATDGGMGGGLHIVSGNVDLGAGATLDFRGGNGGSSVTGRGADGGDGGRVVVSGGTLNLFGATLNVAGGTGGFGAPSGIPPQPRSGNAGHDGGLDISDGEVIWHAGHIIGRTLTTPSAPLALVSATLNHTGGMLDTTAGTLSLADATFNQTGGTLRASTIEVGSGATFNFSGGAVSVVQFKGNLVQSGGTLSPGASPGLTTVDGDYSLGANGSILMEIGGELRGSQHDAVNVTGLFTAGGTLDVVLLDGYSPDLGSRFDLFNFAAFAGVFDVINLPNLAPDLAFDLSALYTDGVISVAPAAVPLPPAAVLMMAAIPVLWRRRRLKN